MYNNFFLNYENDSKKKLHEYMAILEEQIEKKTDVNMPYIEGKFEKNLEIFLREKSMPYSTALPENVLHNMAEYFSGMTRWHHPYVMNNIKTPVNLLSLAVIYNAMMFDPNLAGDTNCGQSAFAELEVIKYLSDLIGWDWRKTGGYFTFGGTSTLMNAVKIGINNVIDDACQNGIGEEIFIVSSEQGHSAHADVCNWLGIGKKSCVRVPVDSNYQMDIKKTEEIITQKIGEGKKWAGIIVCGGTTIQTIVDPIYDIYVMREKLIKKFNLPYSPHIHVDSVVGWVWLFYKKYSFSDNTLNLTSNALTKIEKMCKLISLVKYADSVGIDFHKTGFCPYASSLILVKNGSEIYKLNDKEPIDLKKIKYGKYSPSSYTLELSRSSIGPLSALTALKLLGYEGYQKLLGDIIEGVCSLVKSLSERSGFEVVNQDTNGTCILFIVKPSDLNLVYDKLLEATENEIKNLALYNYKFYLFVLSKIENNEIDFFIDYSSGYKKEENGFHMGILKMQTFNPMLTEEKAQHLAGKIEELKKQFDLCSCKFKNNFVYEPKSFKLKYNNNKYKICGDEVCIKK